MKTVKHITTLELDELRADVFKSLENGIDTLTPDEVKVAVDVCSYSPMVLIDNHHLAVDGDYEVITSTLIASESPVIDMMTIKAFLDTVLETPSSRSLCSYTTHTFTYKGEVRSFIGINVTLPHGYTFENFWHKYLQHTSYAYSRALRAAAALKVKSEA